MLSFNPRAKIALPIVLTLATALTGSLSRSEQVAVRVSVADETPAVITVRGPRVSAASFTGWVVPVPRRFQAGVAGAAARYGVPPNLLAAVLSAESSWKPRVVGDGGHSFGLAQIHLPDFPGVTAAQAMTPSFAIDWAAKSLGGRWRQSRSDVIATVLFHNCPVCSFYYARTGRYGPSAALARAGARYVVRVFGPLGGARAAERLRSPVRRVG